VFQPLSSEAGAGSLVLPAEKAAEVPPTKEAVPVPTDGAMTPVLGLPSGVGLLKFH